MQFIQNHQNMDIFEQIGKHNGSNRDTPMFCALHGKYLEFFCFDDKQRVCGECVRNQHKTHKFNFINVCANINKELLDLLKLKSAELQLERKVVHQKQLRKFKSNIREEILDMKEQSVNAVNDACTRILTQLNKGDLRNVEREMELFQTFFYNKIQNFNLRIKSAMDQVAKALREERFHEVMLEKEKIEGFESEISILGE